MKKFFLGFTLAEVLITLSIIGVVAALTIPTLINNYQKRQYVTQLKKQYSLANQVLQRLAYDNGGTSSLAQTGLFGAGKTVELGDIFSSYYKVTKNCKNSTEEVCFPPYCSFYNGVGAGENVNDYDTIYKFVAADGASIAIASYYNNCSYDIGLNDASPTKNVCADLYIDLNGLKGPNSLGRDVFFFYITSNKSPILYPRGGFEDNGGKSGTTQGDRYWKAGGYCTDSNKGGRWCAGRVIDEGWEMNY